MKAALIEIAAELMEYPSEKPISRRVLEVKEIDSMEEQDGLISKYQSYLKEGEVLTVKGGFTHKDDEFDAADRQQEWDIK